MAQIQPTTPASAPLEIVSSEIELNDQPGSIQIFDAGSSETEPETATSISVPAPGPALSILPEDGISLALSPATAEVAPANDPIDRGLSMLQSRNQLRGAVIFSAAPGGSRRYGFARQVSRPELSPTWQDMGMDASDFQEIFARLGKFGFIEYSPVASTPNTERAGFRTAFGIGGSEWLTLVRIGSSNAPEAIVAIVSDASIQAHLPFFHSAATARAA